MIIEETIFSKVDLPSHPASFPGFHGKDQDKVIKAIKSGATNYVLKPVRLRKLEEAIAKLLKNPIIPL